MEKYKVIPGKRVKISEFDPDGDHEFDFGKKEAKEILIDLNKEIEVLQETLYAEHKQKVLIVFQAMDSGGKDGTIRSVFEGVNPQGVKVTSFKVPTPEELNHDYLWRVHKQVPGSGEIMIFNRSHYEDVLVVRVHQLVIKDVWGKRFDQINQFEKMLCEEGTTILKFFLNISKEEQLVRLKERLEIPEKQWKFRKGDVEERKLWDDYMKAYEDVLSKTSTDWAPWYVIPANRNWVRNIIVSKIIIKRLKELNMSFPAPEEDLAGIKLE